MGVPTPGWIDTSGSCRGRWVVNILRGRHQHLNLSILSNTGCFLFVPNVDIKLFPRYHTAIVMPAFQLSLSLESLHFYLSAITTSVDAYYIPHITLPARITDHRATLIDHILIRPHKPTVGEAMVSRNIYSDISDHLPNFYLFW